MACNDMNPPRQITLPASQRHDGKQKSRRHSLSEASQIRLLAKTFSFIFHLQVHAFVKGTRKGSVANAAEVIHLQSMTGLFSSSIMQAMVHE